jgi:imidazolonepropionase-like amidohydrolase
MAAGDEARRLGLPLIVHATGLAEAKVALRAGARLLVHSVWDQAVDQEFIDLARQAQAVYTPTLTVTRGYAVMGESVAGRQAPPLDDPNGCVDPGTAARIAEPARTDLSGKVLPARVKGWKERAQRSETIASANLKRVADAGVTVATGTDAGNPLTLHGPSIYAEMEAMQAAGLTPMQVLVASTRGGGVAMGRDKDLGTIEKGKWADLLVVAADPTADAGNLRHVRHVVRGGVVRSITELRAVVAAGGR